MRAAILTSMVILALDLSAPRAQAQSVAQFAARFDRMDRRLNNGEGYCAALNTKGELAWSESYILRAYVDMAKATDDAAYLDSEVAHFERLLQNRDDRRGVKDHYRGGPMTGWGSDEYSRGRWHVWAVHTGMICLGPIEFVRYAKRITKWRHAYGKKAEEFLERIKESVAAHDPDFREGPGAGEGYYVDPEVGPLPLNQQNALGSVIVELYNVTRDHVYKDRAARLALYFKNRMRRAPDGTFEWPYWAKPDGATSGPEDISHAAINVDFAIRCRWAHIVFSQKDMQALARTWTGKVRRSENEWADTVAGTGGPNSHIPQAAGRWLDLCAFDHSILEDARRAFAGVSEDQDTGANMLGIAKIARWTRELARKKKRILGVRY